MGASPDGLDENDASSPRSLTAFRLRDDDASPIPAPRAREWMSATPERAAYRCLPLVMANQGGWVLTNPHNFIAVWDGGTGTECTRIQRLDPPEGERPRFYVTSHFGYGILTWHLAFLFRTPPGYNLSVRGPTNYWKDGAAALDAIVETDWAVATFTMNWKLTRPNLPVRFERGEPICMVIPQPRTIFDGWAASEMPLAENPELQRHYLEHSRQRMVALRGSDPALQADDGRRAKVAQGHYARGTSPTGWTASEHRTRINVPEFERVGRDGQADSPAVTFVDTTGSIPGVDSRDEINEGGVELR